jgi:hypothetical protein
MRASGAWLAGGAGSTTLPQGSLYAPAGQDIWLIKAVCGIQGSATGFTMGLRRATSLGGTHTGREEFCHDDPAATALGTLFDVDTGTAPTLTTGNIEAFHFGDAKGSTIVWTFGGRGLMIPAGTGNGVVIVPIAGTPAACLVGFTWEF